MSILALLLVQQVSGEDLGPYNPSASEWWAWAGAACFFVGIVGFSILGLSATEKGRGHFAHKILIVLVAMTSYIALAFTQGVERAGGGVRFRGGRALSRRAVLPRAKEIFPNLALAEFLEGCRHVPSKAALGRVNEHIIAFLAGLE